MGGTGGGSTLPKKFHNFKQLKLRHLTSFGRLGSGINEIRAPHQFDPQTFVRIGLRS